MGSNLTYCTGNIFHYLIIFNCFREIWQVWTSGNHFGMYFCKYIRILHPRCISEVRRICPSRVRIILTSALCRYLGDGDICGKWISTFTCIRKTVHDLSAVWKQWPGLYDGTRVVVGYVRKSQHPTDDARILIVPSVVTHRAPPVPVQHLYPTLMFILPTHQPHPGHRLWNGIDMW